MSGGSKDTFERLSERARACLVREAGIFRECCIHPGERQLVGHLEMRERHGTRIFGFKPKGDGRKGTPKKCHDIRR